MKAYFHLLSSQSHPVHFVYLENMIKTGCEMYPKHTNVEAVREAQHLVSNVAHHTLGNNPQVGGAIEADLGSIGEDRLGLHLGGVQQDDPHLALRYVGYVVVVCLGHHELLLDDEPVLLLCTLFPHLLKEILMASNMAGHYSKEVPIIPKMGNNKEIMIRSDQ